MSETCVKICMKVHVRWMIRRDMTSVIDIDGRANAAPWTENDFLGHLRKRNVIGMVAERGDRILGYVVYRLHRDSVEILRLSVDPEFIGKGIGAQVVGKLKGKLSENRRTTIHVEMRETNTGGLLFLRNQGFRAVGMTRGWYDDTGEDMIQMQYNIMTDAHDREW